MNRRTMRFSDFRAVLADAEALLGTGYDRAGNWSLGQVCDHMSASIGFSLDGFPSRFPWVMRFVARWIVLRAILAHRVFHRRFPAPDYLIPAMSTDDAVAIERFRAVVLRFEAHTGPLAPSPLFGDLSRLQWCEVHLWHCEHHFSFLLPKMATTEPAACPPPQ